MKIEVKHLLSQPEGSVESYPIEIADLSIDEAKTQITGEVVLANLNGLILAQITGQVILPEPCSRCLTEVPLMIPLKFSREFKTERSLDCPARDSASSAAKAMADRRGDNQADEETYPIEDGQIDLNPPLTEEIIANLPIKPLCSDACKGLCQKCGANLNDNPCKCDKVNYEISNKINL